MKMIRIALTAAMMPFSITVATAQINVHNPYPDKPVQVEQLYYDSENGNIVGAEYAYCDGTYSFSGQYTLYPQTYYYDCPES